MCQQHIQHSVGAPTVGNDLASMVTDVANLNRGGGARLSQRDLIASVAVRGGTRENGAVSGQHLHHGSRQRLSARAVPDDPMNTRLLGVERARGEARHEDEPPLRVTHSTTKRPRCLRYGTSPPTDRMSNMNGGSGAACRRCASAPTMTSDCPGWTTIRSASPSRMSRV